MLCKSFVSMNLLVNPLQVCTSKLKQRQVLVTDHTLLPALSVCLYYNFLCISCMHINSLNITHLYITPLNVTTLSITSSVNIAIKHCQVEESISILTCQFVFPIILMDF